MDMKKLSIIIILFVTIIISFGQIFLKLGTNNLKLDLISILANYNLIIGIILYLSSGLLFTIALKYGDLSVLYPINALAYVWVSLLSPYLLDDLMSLLKWIGIFFIVGGVSSIGFGSKK
jgi:drug/metabolite transporter (DMT)-like permease